MAREKNRKIKYKLPKSKDIYDESLDWQEKIEIQQQRRKLNRKSHKKRNEFEKW